MELGTADLRNRQSSRISCGINGSVTTEVVGTERVLTRGKWRTVEVLACPITWRPHPEQIASARRGYEDWWQALDWVRDGLVVGGMLREVEVTAAMPRVRPWAASSPGSER